MKTALVAGTAFAGVASAARMRAKHHGIAARSERGTPASRAAAAGLPTVADTPYEELVSTRLPWDGVFNPLPTGWVAAPSACEPNPGNHAFTANNTALVACGTAGLFDAAAQTWYDYAPAVTTPIVYAQAVPDGFPGLLGVTSTGLVVTTLSASTAQTTPVPVKFPAGVESFGVPRDIVAYPIASGSKRYAGYQAWVAASGGAFAVNVFVSSSGAVTASLVGEVAEADACVATAYSSALGEVSIANTTHLLHFDVSAANASLPALASWEWITDTFSGWGGPVDDVVTSLAYDPTDGTLYIGNPSDLNVRLPSGEYLSYDGAHGLPYANISSVAPAGDGSGRVWLGTAKGAVLFDPSAAPEAELPIQVSYAAAARRDQSKRRAGLAHGAMTAAAAAEAPGAAPAATARSLLAVAAAKHHRLAAPGTHASPAAPVAASPTAIPLVQRWKYLYGPRYFPTASATDMGSNVNSRGVVSVGSTTVFVTATGLALIASESWTLAKKAALFQTLAEERHTYYGLINECWIAEGFAYLPACKIGPNDNSGLWTSLMVTAEAMRYAVEGTAEAQSAALERYYGMLLLNNVTGIKGLVARTALDAHTPGGGGQDWHNSTAMPGFTWEGDASSDEIAGHALAYPLMAQLATAPGSADWQRVTATAVNLATYIVENDYQLIDITGKPTLWARYNPFFVNSYQPWSDTRGLDALEITALIVGALKVVEPGSKEQATLQAGLDFLLAPPNNYLSNFLNARILTPCDLNFSDDELLYFSYLAIVFNLAPGQEAIKDAVLASMARSWGTLSVTRQGIWAAIMFAGDAEAARLSGASGFPWLSAEDKTGMAGDILWTLRTWSNELFGWPTDNSHRLDVVPNTAVLCGGGGPQDSSVVLPFNERSQTRWNTDPYNIAPDGNNFEGDPGAWLMTYWLARYYGVLEG